MSILLKPGDPEWKDHVDAQQRKLNRIAKASEKATKAQWEMVDFAVQAFIKEYPEQFQAFLRMQAAGRSKYNEATEGGLKKSQFRNVASFPVAYKVNPATGQEESKSLYDIINKIIPNISHKSSVNFIPLLKKYPWLVPGEKIAAASPKG